MAIDTLAKRNSALHMATVIGIIPDSTIDQGDRQTLLKHYSGILAGVVVVVIKQVQKIHISMGISI